MEWDEFITLAIVIVFTVMFVGMMALWAQGHHTPTIGGLCPGRRHWAWIGRVRRLWVVVGHPEKVFIGGLVA